jgi:hypothetical protein
MSAVLKTNLTAVQPLELLETEGGYAPFYPTGPIWLTVKAAQLAIHLTERFAGQQANVEPKDTSTSSDTGDTETPSP